MHLFYRSLSRILAFLLALTATGMAAAIDRDAYSHNSDSGYRNPQWMSVLPDGRLLSELNIPGTHDTMARYGGDIAQTQSMDLMMQLNSGVRALDIRCRHYYDKFTIHHGLIYQNANFDDVLTTARQFLQANPRETLLMRVKEEYNPEGNTRSFADTFADYAARYPGLFWTYSGPTPTLGEARGKIVVLQNFSAPQSWGLNYNNLIAQDDYSMGTNWDLYSKWTKVKNHLAAAVAGSNTSFYINYLSASGGSFPYFVASGQSSPGNGAPLLSTGLTTPGFKSYYPDFPRVSCFIGICTIAFEGTNMLTSERLAAGSYRRTGIIMADFPGRLLLQNIINLNPR
ncbi:1-phosphatidylinositol phosphodiesterase [Fluviicoccus keumensis]|uniref:1-phosphatidylinositol phosphodiesterase n=1 Tax=Fluviicoccus keumensis TaxID=1435465 RepID=A0A4Q7ZBK0_9GAMM|nr:phosphatidylinositol-specific phospholipase C [Fluviicoccus keumensis]RZU47501.1 1-phosphatidylinositol phosphodiesterase [Fluviicoccus keumensis]